MRIVGGKFRSLRLKTLKGDNTRPTSDKVREAIFSSISHQVNFDSMLDLFSGSGAMGIEAISRGFNNVNFNDKSRQATKVIKDNLKSLDIYADVYNLDYKQMLNLDYQYDFIFIDPPFSQIETKAILEAISKNNSLKADGLIIFELARNSEVLDKYFEFIKVKEKRYGNSKLVYFRKDS